MPTRIGRYTVARKLGCGGMGEVFLAYSPAGDPVAVKLIRADRLDPETRARFEKEAGVARTVIGTNRVARFLDADPYADRPWMAMEYVPGRTLLECVDDDSVLPPLLVASLGALLTEGLGVVHAVGLLHRDLKPQNIILGEYGPVIIDFGLAAFADAAKGSLSKSGSIIGTIRCMPPEQAAGHTTQLSSAADVYGLGTVLLYAAAGHYPYDGARWEAIAAQVTNRDRAPDLSGVPEALLPLIASMLAHEAADRPDLDQVAKACTDLMGQLQLPPAEARRALINRTARRNGKDDIDRTASPDRNVEDRILQQAVLLDEHDLVSPLDGPPGALGPTVEFADTPTPPVDERPMEAMSDETPADGVPERRPRVPAAQRIAEELRDAYAQKPEL
ncbi:serine/threonine-protein kinase [Kitasatospora cystarginea]